jgi:hypothetical protein
MKQVMAFATIGACLLVLSSGAALATNAHTLSMMPGQNGTTGPGGITPGIAGCGSTGGGLTNLQIGPEGQAQNHSVTSPFNSTKTYAGHFVGNLSNPHSNSQYDNACFQHQTP